MERRALGSSGLLVGCLGLGTMTWGRGTDVPEATRQLHDFVDAGGNLVDTADVYADGATEAMLGHVLADSGLRQRVVVATKAGLVRDGRRVNTSRGHLLAALDASIDRLGIDHVDLWQVHVWDPRTPLDETLSALDAAVRTGRTRYVGVSNHAGWQLAAATTRLGQIGGAGVGVVSDQVEYSLLERGVEREVVPAAAHLGVGLLAWSPLGRGVLTGKYRAGTPADSRGAQEALGPSVREFLNDRSRRVVDGVVVAADGLGVTPAEVALAWVRDRPGVSAALIGARTVHQLAAALASADLVLPQEIRTALDDVSTPALGYPERGWHQRSP